MTINDIKTFDISANDIRDAVAKALEDTFIDNLRDRHPLVQLDSKVRGNLGESLILRILHEMNIDVINTGTSEEDDTDIDIIINSKNDENIKIEVKTSLVPDSWKTLDAVLRNGDIKIIEREARCEDIRSDIHVQIYYNLLTNQRDNYLSSLNDDISSLSVDELIDLLRLDQLRQAFVAWIDKKTLIASINRLPLHQRTWRFSYREFWKCRISESKCFDEFLSELPFYIK